MFCGVGVCLVFFGAVLPMFLFYFLFFRSRNCLGKILLMSGLVFWGSFSLLLWFFSPTSSSFLFFFERDSSGSNRAHPHTHLFRLFPFPCFCPRRACYRPFWPCVPSFSRFVGVPFWAPGVLAFFGFSRNIGGLEITRPF